MQRRLRALERVQRRELKSLETAQLKHQRIHARRGHDHMPSLTLELKPPGRRAAPHKAKNRHISALTRELAEPPMRTSRQTGVRSTCPGTSPAPPATTGRAARVEAAALPRAWRRATRRSCSGDRAAGAIAIRAGER
jgi:hypothetical protein